MRYMVPTFLVVTKLLRGHYFLPVTDAAFISCQRKYPITFSFKYRRWSPTTSTSMAALPQRSHNRTVEPDDGFFADKNIDSITTYRLLVGDLLSIAIGTQLLGLVDVLNDLGFWANGGWLQPITIVSSTNTLSLLMKRFCIVSFSWIICALAGRGFSEECVESQDMAVETTLKLLPLLLIALIVIEVTAAYSTGAHIDAAEIGCLFYFAALALMAGRYFNSFRTY